MTTTNVHDREHNSIFKFEKAHYEQRDDGLLHCSYCGSLHPSALIPLIQKRAKFELADMKYGFPHKYYIQHDGFWGKFYTLHLQDATDNERKIIEAHINLAFTFDEDGGIGWKAIT